MGLAVAQENFSRRRMAQESERAGRTGVGARLEDSDQVTNLAGRQCEIAAQSIQGRAQRAHYLHRLFPALAQAAGIGDGIVALDGLAEVTGSREMVMHAAIENEEFLAAGFLNVVNAGEVNASFGHEETPWLRQKSGANESGVLANLRPK